MIDSDFFINDTNIKQLLIAWHSLFNSGIDKSDMLLAVDRRIFEHFADEWAALNNDSNKPEIVSFKAPLFKKVNLKNAEITIGKDIQNIASSTTERKEKITALKKVASEFESAFKAEKGDAFLIFSVLLLPQRGKPEDVMENALLKFLTGRVLIFAEINE